MERVYVTFRVLMADAENDECIAVVGTNPELGEWDITKRLVLSTDLISHPWWTSDPVSLTLSDVLRKVEYKYFKLRGETFLSWEEVTENRSIFIRGVTDAKVATNDFYNLKSSLVVLPSGVESLISSSVDISSPSIFSLILNQAGDLATILQKISISDQGELSFLKAKITPVVSKSNQGEHLRLLADFLDFCLKRALTIRSELELVFDVTTEAAFGELVGVVGKVREIRDYDSDLTDISRTREDEYRLWHSNPLKLKLYSDPISLEFSYFRTKEDKLLGFEPLIGNRKNQHKGCTTEPLTVSDIFSIRPKSQKSLNELPGSSIPKNIGLGNTLNSQERKKNVIKSFSSFFIAPKLSRTPLLSRKTSRHATGSSFGCQSFIRKYDSAEEFTTSTVDSIQYRELQTMLEKSSEISRKLGCSSNYDSELTQLTTQALNKPSVNEILRLLHKSIDYSLKAVQNSTKTDEIFPQEFQAPKEDETMLSTTDDYKIQEAVKAAEQTAQSLIEILPEINSELAELRIQQMDPQQKLEKLAFLNLNLINLLSSYIVEDEVIPVLTRKTQRSITFHTITAVDSDIFSETPDIHTEANSNYTNEIEAINRELIRRDAENQQVVESLKTELEASNTKLKALQKQFKVIHNEGFTETTGPDHLRLNPKKLRAALNFFMILSKFEPPCCSTFFTKVRQASECA